MNRKAAARRPKTTTQEAEAVIHALRTHQVDAIVGERNVSLVRLKQVELELQSSRDQLRVLAARLEFQRESERAEVAREIHDELGQSLTSLQLGLAWLTYNLTLTQPVRAKLASMSALIGTTIRSVKQVVTRLRPSVLDELGLVKTLRSEARAFADHTGVKCRFETNLRNVTCHRAGSLAVFRIVQAALTNVARHAHATRAVIGLMKRRNDLVVTVKDNGRGVAKAQVAKPGACGVIGMRERALTLDGTLVLAGARDKGTTLTVRIPLSRVLITRRAASAP